jgi:CO/xanthine dehydrogenase FAD-binding subunit
MILEGKALTDERIEQAAAEAASCITPLPNIGSTVGYRKRMVKVLVKRAMTDLMHAS